MRNIIALSKVMLLNKLGSLLGSKKKKKAKREGSSTLVRSIIMLVVLFLLMFASFFFIANTLGKLAKQADFLLELGEVLSLAFIVIIILFSITFVYSTFFTAKDNDLWLPMPIKTSEIFVARFISCMATIYYIELVSIMPFLLGFTVGAKLPFEAILGQIIYIVFLPIPIIAVFFMFTLLISNFFDFQRHRKFFDGLMFAIIIIGSLSFSVLMSIGGERIGSLTEEIQLAEDPTALLEGLKVQFSTISNAISWSLFITFFSRYMFVGGLWAVIGPLLMAIAGILLFFLAVLFSRKSYTRVLYAPSAPAKKKSVKKTKHKALKRNQHPVWVIFVRDLKNVVRSTTYLFNVLFAPLIALLAMTISMVISFVASGDPNMDVSNAPSFSNMALTNYPALTFIILISLINFLNAMNFTSGTSFTREGSHISVIKSYPIKSRHLLYGKLILGTSFSAVIYFIILLTFFIIAGGPFYLFVIFLLCGIVTIIALNYISIFFDLRFPYLNWTTELQAVKQNKNIIFNMLIGFGVLLINIIYLLIIIFANLPLYAAILMVVITFGAIIAGFEIHINKKGYALLDYLQV